LILDVSSISAPSSHQGRTILAPCLHQPYITFV